MRTDEQVLHDRINLPRLVKRLERSVQDDDWSKTKSETWLRAQAMLQQIRHARVLLQRVQLDNVDPTPAEERRYQHVGTTLQHLENYIRQVEQQSMPPVRRPKPLLPSIRPPTTKPPPPPAEPASPPVEETLIPAEPETSPPVPDVPDLLPASPDLPVASTSSAPAPSSTLAPTPVRPTKRNLFPGFYPSPSPSPTPTPTPAPAPTSASSLAPPTTSTTTITATPTILSNARAHHDVLSEQLAQMATQLRRNATHVSQAFDKDRSVVESLQEKIDGNLGSMQRERIRLRDVRVKSGGTTCLVMMSVVVVLIAFIVMVFVIRLTR